MTRKMLNILLILALTALDLSKAIPVRKESLETEPKISMYDAVLKKCPAIEKTSIKNHTEFKMCADWSKIETRVNNTTKFSAKSIADIRCVLYYDTLISFCTNAADLLDEHPNIVHSIKLDKNADIIKICEKESPLFNGVNREHNLSAIIIQNSTVNDCLGLCLSIDTYSTDTFCYKAYYFASFKMDALKTKIQDVANGLPNSAEGDKADHQNPVDKSSVVLEAQNGRDSEKQSDSHVESKPAQEPNKGNIEPSVDASQNGKKPGEKSGNSNKTAQNLGKKAQAQAEVKQNAVVSNNQIVAADEVIPDAKPPSTPAQKVTKPSAVAKNVQPANSNGQIESNALKEEDKMEKEEEALMKNDINGDFSDDEDTANGDDHIYEDIPKENAKNSIGKAEEVKKSKPEALEDDGLTVTQEEISDGESYFFSYFMAMMCFCIFGYVGYHNRQKIFALVLEGKRGRRPQRGGRRPNSANYHKLDSNLEEALSSSVKKSASNVIY